jgi:hypothetical protein
VGETMQLEYPVSCQAVVCKNPAQFKIASQWSDGVTHELKTYSLACAACLPSLLRQAREHQKACPRSTGESLGKPGIYERNNPRNSRELSRRTDLETA